MRYSVSLGEPEQPRLPPQGSPRERTYSARRPTARLRGSRTRHNCRTGSRWHAARLRAMCTQTRERRAHLRAALTSLGNAAVQLSWAASGCFEASPRSGRGCGGDQRLGGRWGRVERPGSGTAILANSHVPGAKILVEQLSQRRAVRSPALERPGRACMRVPAQHAAALGACAAPRSSRAKVPRAVYYSAPRLEQAARLLGAPPGLAPQRHASAARQRGARTRASIADAVPALAPPSPEPPRLLPPPAAGTPAVLTRVGFTPLAGGVLHEVRVGPLTLAAPPDGQARRGDYRTVRVWLPDKVPPGALNVLIMHDGQNLFTDDFAFGAFPCAPPAPRTVTSAG